MKCTQLINLLLDIERKMTQDLESHYNLTATTTPVHVTIVTINIYMLLIPNKLLIRPNFYSKSINKETIVIFLAASRILL